MKCLNQMYLAGVCGGFGLGLMVGGWISWGQYWPLLMISSSFFMTIGTYMNNTALRAEQKPPASHTGLE